MTDVLTPEQRSFCMSRNRGKDTKPEILLRRELWNRGFRYRLTRKLIGKPDMVFVSKKVAIFVDGCFWHGCPEHGTQPKTNAGFWQAKIARNKERDQEVTLALTQDGWNVLRFWEHQVKNDLPGCIAEVERALRGRG